MRWLLVALCELKTDCHEDKKIAFICTNQISRMFEITIAYHIFKKAAPCSLPNIGCLSLPREMLGMS